MVLPRVDSLDVVPVDEVDHVIEGVRLELSELERRLRQTDHAAAEAERQLGLLGLDGDDGNPIELLRSSIDDLLSARRNEHRGAISEAAAKAAARLAAANAEADAFVGHARRAVADGLLGPDDRPFSPQPTPTRRSTAGWVPSWLQDEPPSPQPAASAAPATEAAAVVEPEPEPEPEVIEAGVVDAEVVEAVLAEDAQPATQSVRISADPARPDRWEPPATTTTAASSVTDQPARDEFGEFWQAQHLVVTARTNLFEGVITALLPMLALVIVLVVVLAWIG